MKKHRLAKHRTFTLVLAAVTLLHLLLLLVPVVRQQALEPAPSPSIAIRLSPPPAQETPPEPLTEPEPDPDPEPIEPPPLEPVEPIELAELPETPSEPAKAIEQETPPINAYRILSDLRDKQKADPLASSVTIDPRQQPDYFVRAQPMLEDVINEPSLQLPFRDTRIYLVDSYDEGFLGGMEKFFDDVTVPFGFTTKNNTRVQCAWILVLAGCSWGDVSYYYARDKARKRKPESM